MRFRLQDIIPLKLIQIRCLAELLVTAMADGEIMAVEHKKYPVYGLQFHPESILTPKGIDILRNLVESIRK